MTAGGPLLEPEGTVEDLIFNSPLVSVGDRPQEQRVEAPNHEARAMHNGHEVGRMMMMINVDEHNLRFYLQPQLSGCDTHSAQVLQSSLIFTMNRQRDLD